MGGLASCAVCSCVDTQAPMPGVTHRALCGGICAVTASPARLACAARPVYSRPSVGEGCVGAGLTNRRRACMTIVNHAKLGTPCLRHGEARNRRNTKAGQATPPRERPECVYASAGPVCMSRAARRLFGPDAASRAGLTHRGERRIRAVATSLDRSDSNNEERNASNEHFLAWKQ